jgi:hypothetical protein
LSVTHVRGRGVAFTRHGLATASVTCPVGTQALAGGHQITGPAPARVSVIDDHAVSSRRWTVTARASGGGPRRRLVASATCLRQ